MTVEFDTFHQQSVTAIVCENAQLFGSAPNPREHDPCKFWDREEVHGVGPAGQRITAQWPERSD